MEKVATEGFTWEAIISLYKSWKSQSVLQLTSLHPNVSQTPWPTRACSHWCSHQGGCWKPPPKPASCMPCSPLWPRGTTSCLIRLETSILHGQKHLQCFFKPGKGCFPSSYVKNLGMWSSKKNTLFQYSTDKFPKTKGPANITIRLDQDGKGDHIWLHRSLLKNVWETLRPPGSPWHPYLFCHPSERGLLPHLLIDLHGLINLTCSGEAFDQSCIKHLGK